MINKTVEIDKNVFIGENVKIGAYTKVQWGAYIEDGCEIGHHSIIGRNTFLRSGTKIGDYSIFGNLSVSEGENSIGSHTTITSQCHLTRGIIVEDCVFIATFFVGANDPDMLHLRRHVKPFFPQAPHIKYGARIAVNVTVLPNVTIGRESVVGAGSVVTRNVPDYTIVYGNPARKIGLVPKKWRL